MKSRNCTVLALVLLGLAMSATQTHSQSTYTPYAVGTFAGLPGVYNTNDGTGNAARFDLPHGVAVDNAGNVYVADTANSTIRKVTPARVVTTLAGLARHRGSADGTGSDARFYYPFGVVVDNAGNLYVADTFNHTIRKITPTGAVTTLAGLAGALGDDDGTGDNARFYYPMGIALDTSGGIYVADEYNHTIRKVTPEGEVTTLAGLAGVPGDDDKTGSDARFYFPVGIAVDSAGNVYVGDSSNHTIRKITPDGAVTTLAGLAGVPGSADGMGSDARFNVPGGVAVDSMGNVYVADGLNYTIRKVTPTGVVTTMGGLAGVPGSADGTGSEARFSISGYPSPASVAVDNIGNLYVADPYNYTIRRGFAADGAPVIIASGSLLGFSGSQFGFNLAGPAGREVVIDASDDLLNWLPIVTNTFGAGALPFSDPQSGVCSNRFYRARVP